MFIEINKIAPKHLIDQTGVLCIVLHIGDLALVLNRSDYLLAKNRHMDIPQLTAYLVYKTEICNNV